MPQRIVFPQSNVVELEDFKSEKITSTQIRISTKVSLISAGTETRCLRGNYAPGTHWDNWIKYPFYPGYASIGVVEEVGSDATKFSIGQTVAIRAPHASEFIAEESKFTAVPDNLDIESAIWLAMAKIAFIGNRAAQCKLGSSAVILGAGPIGQMSLRWALSSGAGNVTVIDIESSRLDIAKKAGADHIICGGAAEAIDQVAKIYGETGPDAVIDTTGNPAVFQAALAMAPRFGRVVVLGDVGDPSQQCLSPDLILKGISIVGAHDCQTYDKWTQSKVFELFFHHCLSGQINMNGINTHFFTPQNAPQAYEAASNQHEKTMGVIIRWQ